MKTHQSFYAKRELFNKYGLYNLRYKIAMDCDLLFRFLYCNNLIVKLLDTFIVKFSLGGTSTKSLKNIYKQNKECFKVWKENGQSIPFYTIPVKLLRKISQFIKAKLP